MSWIDIEVPTFSIDKDSKEKLACYPQRTFYPLCDDPSTRCHQITRADFFNPCSNCHPHSQVCIYPCTLLWILVQMSIPLAHLRYSFEDYRPSKTNTVTLSSFSQKVSWSKSIGGISLPVSAPLGRSLLFRIPPSSSTHSSLNLFSLYHITIQLRCMGSFRLPHFLTVSSLLFQFH